MAFKRTPAMARPSNQNKKTVTVLETVPVEIDGKRELHVLAKVLEVTDPEQNNLPTTEEYTLENLLLAGVQLDRIPMENYAPQVENDASQADVFAAIKTIVESNNDEK